MRFGRLCRRLVPLGVVIFATSIAVALMFRWGYLCTNINTLNYIENLCLKHLSGEIIGNLCEPLCIEDSVTSLSCHPTNNKNGISFSANWKGKKILVKTPKRISLDENEFVHWSDTDNVKIYPSNDQFRDMIKELVVKKINITLSNEEANEISRLPGEDIEDHRVPRRMLAMDNAWLLLQDNEYLNAMLFAKNDLFPKHIGTCGSLYAVEYGEIVRGTSALFSLEDDDEEWERRIHIAAMILDFLNKLDLIHLQLCDVQLKYFGLVNGRIKYLSADKIRKRGNRPVNHICKEDYDCEYLDCKTTCNLESNRCESQIESDNLQMICEKIYLGWTAAGRIILPGLLISAKTSSGLATLLRQCANSQYIPHSSALRQALYNTLIRRN